MENKNLYPTWMDILSIIGIFFLSGVAVSLAASFLGLSIDNGFNMFLGYTTQLVLTIIYALGLKKWRTGTYKDVMGFSFRGANPRLILYGVLLIVCITIVLEPVVDLFPKEYLDMLNKSVGSGGWAMLTSILAAPILEEVLFRGVLQEGLTRKYGVFRGILIASVIFGAIHIIPQQVIVGMFAGLVLGYIYYKTHSLISVILIHSINNAMAQFSIIITGNSTTTLRSLLNNDNIYFIIYGVCLTLIALSAWEVTATIKRDNAKKE